MFVTHYNSDIISVLINDTSKTETIRETIIQKNE